jgi:hypothetical protein
MDKAKDRVVEAGKEKMASVGKEMHKAKDKVSKAGTSAKDRITGVKKNPSDELWVICITNFFLL